MWHSFKIYNSLYLQTWDKFGEFYVTGVLSNSIINGVWSEDKSKQLRDNSASREIFLVVAKSMRLGVLLISGDQYVDSAVDITFKFKSLMLITWYNILPLRLVSWTPECMIGIKVTSHYKPRPQRIENIQVVLFR